MWTSVVVALALVVVTGCTENKLVVDTKDAASAVSNAPVSEDIEEPDAGGRTSSATTDGTCNALVQRGEDFGVYETQASMPAPKGGAIEDGVYVAVRGTNFGSTGREGRRVGRGHATTMEIVGGEVHIVTYGETTADVERSSGVVRTAGVELVLDAKCFHPPDPTAPGLPSGRSPYTFEDGKLRLYSRGSAPPAEITYERRD